MRKTEKEKRKSEKAENEKVDVTVGKRRVTFVCTARNSASIRIIARRRLIGPEIRVSVVIGSVSVCVKMPRVLLRMYTEVRA